MARISHLLMMSSHNRVIVFSLGAWVQSQNPQHRAWNTTSDYVDHTNEMPLISHPGSLYYTEGSLGGDGDDSNGNYKHFQDCDGLSQILLGLMRSFSKNGTEEMPKCITFTYICPNPGIIFF